MPTTLVKPRRGPALAGPSIVLLILLGSVRAATPATTYTWNVPSGTWTAPASWSPARTAPAADDILVFDGAVTPSASVTQMITESIGQLLVTGNAFVTFGTFDNDTVSIAGDAGEDFVVASGSTLGLSSPSGTVVAIALMSGATGRVSGVFTAAGGVHRLLPTDPGSLSFESGSQCRTLAGFGGSLFGNTGANGVVLFRAGSIYEHNSGLHPFGMAAPNSRVTFQHGSLARYLAVSGNGTFGGRVHANCEIGPGAGAPVTIGGGAPPVTFDHLTIFSGGFRNQGPTGANFVFHGNLRVEAPGSFEQTPSPGPSTLRFDAPVVQVVSGTGTIRLGSGTVLEVANPLGVALQRDLFTDGTVALTGGHVTTGAHTLGLGQVATVTGPNWVIGNLSRIIPGSAGTVTRTFEIGDALRAAPITVSFASVGDSGVVLARTDPGDHADLASSGLDPAHGVDRWWRMQNHGVAFTTCDVTLHFDPADVDAGADPDTFLVGRHDGVAWSLPTIGTRTATSTQAVALTAFSDFVVAEEEGTVDVESVPPPASFLALARPSPFGESTVLEYTLGEGGAIELAIFAVDGRRIRTLERGERSAGAHRAGWDGKDDAGRRVAAGIYLVTLVTSEGRFQRKVIRGRP